MLSIWNETSESQPDGIRYIRWRNRNDLDYLYDTGFVDTDKFKREEWIDSFKESLKSDGSYEVTQDQWLAKRPFRYEGRTGEPFDPGSLREGEWDIAEIEKLIREKVAPSTTIGEGHFYKGFRKARREDYERGKFTVNKPFKFMLRQLLLQYPSPRRMRELAVAGERENLKRRRRPAKAAPTKPSGPSQVSRFSTGPSKEQNARAQLDRLLKKV